MRHMYNIQSEKRLQSIKTCVRSITRFQPNKIPLQSEIRNKNIRRYPDFLMLKHTDLKFKMLKDTNLDRL